MKNTQQTMLIAKKKKTGFASDLLKLMSGTLFAQLFGILATPLLTRFYTPEAYGVLALFTSVISIIGIITCMRYELSIMLPDNDEEAINLLGASLGFTVLISMLTMLVIWIADESLLQGLNIVQIGRYLWFIPLSVFFTGVLIALNYWNSRTKNFGLLSIVKVIHSMSVTLIMLIAGYAGYATIGIMICSSVIGQAIAAIVLGWQVFQRDKELILSSVRWELMFSGIKRYKKFPLIDIWGAFMNTISWQLPTFLLAFFFSKEIVGYYALAFRCIKQPLSLISSSLSQVFFQRISETVSHQEKLSKNVEIIFQKLVALGLFPALLLSVIGQELFMLIFGYNWAEAGIYAQILSIYMFFWFISSPLSNIFIVLERQEYIFVVHLIILISRVFSLALGGVYNNVYLSLSLFAGSGILVYGSLAIWNVFLSGMQLKTIFLILFRYLFYCLPAIAFLILLKTLKVDSLLLIIIGTMELILYYIFIIRNDSELSLCFQSFISKFMRRNL